MDDLVVRYGSNFDLSIEINDVTATSVTFYVGNEGEVPVISVTSDFVEGVAYISMSQDDTRVPLGTYKYQISVYHAEHNKDYKYPTEEYCDGCELPSFIVLEALDETEVVS